MARLFLASNFYIVSTEVSRLLQNEQQGKKALYITTAAEGEEGSDLSWLDDDRNALRAIGLEPVDYTIAGKSQQDFTNDFQNIRYILVSGGNVFYLLEKAQQSGFIQFIKEYIQQSDVVYFGSSAGSVIAGADISPVQNLDDTTKAPNLNGHKGFGFIDICLLPHWGSDNFREHYLTKGLAHAYNDNYKLVFLTDKQFLYVAHDGSYTLLEI